MAVCEPGLFQSDYDIDTLSDFDNELGLIINQQDGEAKGGFERNGAPFHYTLYLCTDNDVTRAFLETPDATTGVSPLDVVLTKCRTRALAPPKGGIYHPTLSGHKFVLLVAGAMKVGCNLSEGIMEALRDVFTRCGLRPVAVDQMNAALNGPNGYKNQPWDFNSRGLIETKEDAMDAQAASD